MSKTAGPDPSPLPGDCPSGHLPTSPVTPPCGLRTFWVLTGKWGSVSCPSHVTYGFGYSGLGPMCRTEKAGTTCSGLALCQSSSWAPPTYLQQLGRRATRGAMGNAPPLRGAPHPPGASLPGLTLLAPPISTSTCAGLGHTHLLRLPPAHGVPWKPPAAAVTSPATGLPLFRGPGSHAPSP